MAGPLSGGGINPTISLAILSVEKMIRPNGRNLEGVFFIPYLVGPLIGGAVAALLLVITTKISPSEEETIEEARESIARKSVGLINVNHYTSLQPTIQNLDD